MLDISTRLLYYKRKDIQKALVESCQQREVGIRYGDGFGKRPDILVYDNDVLESAKKGATSFHISEERWSNPLHLSTEMRKDDLNGLRSGWDLVLDIDCPYWTYSKLTTHLFIKALKLNGIKSVSCKFSGNKGFHIGVPFEAFPQEINNTQIKDRFPEGPKKIALYLVDYIATNFIKIGESGEVNFDNIIKTTITELSKETGKTEEELSVNRCAQCMSKLGNVDIQEKVEFICPQCSTRIVKSDGTKIMACPKCNILMAKYSDKKPVCKKCGSKESPIRTFEPLSIVEVDTILISSRHMFRSPYSLHEKSGLASVPIPPDSVLSFEKDFARPENVHVDKNPVFLDTSGVVKGEATNLMTAAFDYGKENLQYETILNGVSEENKSKKEFEDIKMAIPVELFPPCMLKILEGLDDGKKRSLFLLTNFLTSVGWDHNSAEALLIEWNKKNKEPLRDGMIKSQITYHRQRSTKMLPPNCRQYYQDFHVCIPDGLCERIRNPVQYSKRKAFVLNKKTAKRATLTDDQKKMRKEYREKLKKEKINSSK